MTKFVLINNHNWSDKSVIESKNENNNTLTIEVKSKDKEEEVSDLLDKL